MKHYTINEKGMEVIKRVLQDVHINYGAMSDTSKNDCSLAYAQDAEDSANAGDSVAVFEIHKRLTNNGVTQAYSLDIVECFDTEEVEE